jgi:hypothetical protein
MHLGTQATSGKERMFTLESILGMVLGLLVIGIGTFLGVRSTMRRRDEE